jgi:hypothetical protein
LIGGAAERDATAAGTTNTALGVTLTIRSRSATRSTVLNWPSLILAFADAGSGARF